MNGGWYILRDWNEADFDRNAILVKLHVRYGVSPFFKISVEPNPHMPGHNSIRISPSGLGLPDKEYYYRDKDDLIQVAYKEYISDVIRYLSTARNEATKFGTDMYFYEKRIAEVTPDTIFLQNPIATYNPVSISELKDTTSLIPFFDILQVMYPDSNITETTEVIVTSLEYLTQISQIISSTDRKTMNGYLIWTLVRNYIPYLSEKYTSAMDIFNSKLFGVQKPLERWEICSGLVNKFMGLATNNYFENINPIGEETVETVNATFSLIVDVVKNRIGTFQNTALLYNHLNLKLSSLRLQIGVPSNARNETFLKKYYVGLKILKSNFFESVAKGTLFQKKMEEKRLTNSAPEESVLFYALAGVPKVEYCASEHTIVIPRSLLTEPVFENNYPRSIIYGRLGVEIAEAVVSSVFPYDSLWTADRKILSPFHMIVEESIRTAQSASNCLSDRVLDLDLGLPYDTNNETLLKALKHISAISIANEALKLALEKIQHIHQPSLENYEDSAIFFLSYAQTECSVATNQRKLYDNMVHLQLPQRSMLHLAWTQLPEFAESLECNFNKNLQCSDIF